MSIESQQIINNALNPEDPVDSRIATILSQLEDYNREMSPGLPISSEDGARWQKRLYTIIIDTLRLPDEAFIRTWDALLVFAHRKRGESFRSPLPFRFPEHVALTRREYKNFQRLVHLITLTSNPSTRIASLKQVSIDSTVKELTGAQADKIRAFYHVQ